MALSDGCCDSCGEPHDVLFPIAILDESPYGGMHLVQKWYCYDCLEEIRTEEEDKATNPSKDNKEEDEDGDEEEESD